MISAVLDYLEPSFLRMFLFLAKYKYFKDARGAFDLKAYKNIVLNNQKGWTNVCGGVEMWKCEKKATRETHY